MDLIESLIQWQAVQRAVNAAIRWWASKDTEFSATEVAERALQRLTRKAPFAEFAEDERATLKQDLHDFAKRELRRRWGSFG